jgi:hypothetical protein
VMETVPPASRLMRLLCPGLLLLPIIVWFSLWSALLLPSSAAANDAYVGSVGGGVFPLESEDIRMERETVQAVMYGRFAEYRVDFEFRNEGPEQTVALGFPFAYGELERRGEPFGVVGFRAWQGDRPLEVELRAEAPASAGIDDQAFFRYYYVHEAVFPRGLTHVRVSYLARPGGSAGTRFPPPSGQPSGAFHWYTYWLHTGAGWQGEIAKAVIRHSLADTFLGWDVELRAAEVDSRWAKGTTYPEGYAKLGERTYQWVYGDFEPRPRDLVLTCYLERGMSETMRERTRERLEELLPPDTVLHFQPEVPIAELPEGVPSEAMDYWARYSFALPAGAEADALRHLLFADDSLPDADLAFGPPDWGYYPYDVTLAYTLDSFWEAGGTVGGPRVTQILPELPEGRSALRELQVGSRVEFELAGLETVREIRVVPGDLDAPTGDLAASTGDLDAPTADSVASPRLLRFTFTDGSSAEVELTAEPEVQRFAVEAAAGRVVMEVLALQPGAGERGTLWQVEFGGEPAPAFAEFTDLITEEQGLVDPGASVEPPESLLPVFELLAEDAGPPADTPVTVLRQLPVDRSVTGTRGNGETGLRTALFVLTLAGVGLAGLGAAAFLGRISRRSGRGRE